RTCDETAAVARWLVLAPADTLAAKRRRHPVAGAGAPGRRKNTRLDSAADCPNNHTVVGRPNAAAAAGHYMDLRTGRCREDTRLGSAADWLEMNTTQVVDSRQAAIAAVNIARRHCRASR